MKVPTDDDVRHAFMRLRTQAREEIGVLAVSMVFYDYLGGAAYGPEDRVLHDHDARAAALDRSGELLTALHPRVEDLIPELFGPPGEHPAWAKEGSGDGR